MLGSALYRYYSEMPNYTVYGTGKNYLSRMRGEKFVRQKNSLLYLDVESLDDLKAVFKVAKPDVVINCIGLVKQAKHGDNAILSIKINSLFPNILAQLCVKSKSRLVHFSTDCVFSGERGEYSEGDIADSRDLYGLSKLLGEVCDSNCLTLRTSLIGHELYTNHSLIDWFLSQKGKVSGYRKAIFSGFPTYEIARILDQFILPNNELSGLYHLSSSPISKFELLNLVSKEYGISVRIEPVDAPSVNRVLISKKFKAATGYSPQSWPDFIKLMHECYKKYEISSK
ncbi:SDR family oxidoreductase [Polynucleobacter sp. es-GGE-1]|nr:SDR family oxidoreductase [Polynucleobacter sp. es-GGE-1]